MNWILTTIISLVVLIFLAGLRVVHQYERRVRLRFGKYKDVLEPGLRWIIPVVDQLTAVDIRQTTIDLQSQEVLSKDNVNLKIDGVLFYTVEKPENAFLNVENLVSQLKAKATSELKEIIGDMTMQDALTKREFIAKRLKEMLNDAVMDKNAQKNPKEWGVVIRGVQINNIELPPQLVRAMAKAAEAEREKLSRIIKAEGEFLASKKLQEASGLYKNNPAAMRLRELQTYQEIGTEQNSLIIVAPEKTDFYGLSALGKDMLNHNIKNKKKQPK